jgi:hypothetical protein
MNLIGHALYLGENEEELKLLQNLVAWLLDNKEGTELSSPVLMREHQDQVGFSLGHIQEGVNWLYWREAFHPDWHAYLHEGAESQEIPIYRGGPGFMLMPIQASFEDPYVTITWEPPLIEKVSGIISILGIILIFGLILDGLVLGGNAFTWIRIVMTMRLPKPILDEEIHAGKEKQKLISTDILEQSEKLDQSSSEEEIIPTISEALVIDEPLNDEEHNLLKSWLINMGHEDDAWVKKILGNGKRE